MEIRGVMVLCRSVKKRHFYRKHATLTMGAFYFDLSFMRINYRFHITHAEAKSFYIMQVTGMGAVKFFEYTFNRFLAHTYAIIFHPDNNIIFGAMG